MLWRKPSNLKYTDLCVYIDSHVKEIEVSGANPEVEDKIYNYLWLLVKALAIKKRMFNSFQDYDGYAFYSANRLFYALRKNLQNQGQVIKGKEIKPIKSCLNYTKALMYPMKLEYLKETYAMTISINSVSKDFDAFRFTEKLKENISNSQGTTKAFIDAVNELFEDISSVLDSVLVNSPFEQCTPEYKKLKISLLLNSINNLKNKKNIDAEPVTVQLWKLPKSMSAYVKVFLKEFGAKLKTEIMHCYHETRLDDKILEYLIANPEGEFVDHEE